jgi:hypothetical protein
VQSRFSLYLFLPLQTQGEKKDAATIGARNPFSAFLPLENLQNQRKFQKSFRSLR